MDSARKQKARRGRRGAVAGGSRRLRKLLESWHAIASSEWRNHPEHRLVWSWIQYSLSGNDG